MDLKIKLFLEDEGSKFMGIGVLWLLQNLEEEKSLRSAANKMGISYSKAYKMMTMLEKSLGKQILERHKGGHDRFGSNLTDYGKSFMKIYDAFQTDCKKLLEKPFEDFKKELEKIN